MPTTYTYTYTRTEALVDQVDLFLLKAGVHADTRSRVVNAVNSKWVEGIGAFVEKDGKRVLEGSIEISWSVHSDHADLTISSDLPGWDGGAAPELSILATRISTFAKSESLSVGCWMQFLKSIRDDPVLYKMRREETGFTGDAPEWKSTPTSHRIVLQDMTEAHATLRSAK